MKVLRLGKPASRVVLVVHCTRALSQRVKWGQNPNLAVWQKPVLAWRKGGLVQRLAWTLSSSHGVHTHGAHLLSLTCFMELGGLVGAVLLSHSRQSAPDLCEL